MQSSTTASSDFLAADLGAAIRALYRMRAELLRAGAWLSVEAAAAELARAQRAVIRHNNNRGPQ